MEIAVQIEDGWYPDPHDPARLRWWADGDWTPGTVPAADARTGAMRSTETVDPTASGLSSPPTGPRLDDVQDTAEGPWRPSRRLGFSLAALVLVAAGLSAVAATPPWPGWTVASDDEPDQAEPARPAGDHDVDPDIGPPMELEVIDFREKNPLDLPWRTFCNGEWEDVEIALVADGDGGLVGDGWTAPAPAYEVRTDNVVFGDVTGDGREDAVFRTFCLQNATLEWIEVWTHDDAGEPMQLEPTVQLTKFDGVIDRHEVVDGQVRIHWSTGVPWDQHPHLNGYPVQVVTDHTWSGRAWDSAEVSRQPESYEGCEDPSGSAEATARCFVESVQRGRWQIATTVADTETVEWLREEGLRELDGVFAGCGPARLPQQPDRVACFVQAPNEQFAQLDVYEIGSGYRVDGIFFGSGSATNEVVGAYGSDPYFDELWEGCANGSWSDCSTLYLESPLASNYEWFGSTCGGIDTFGACDYFDDW